VCPKCEPHLAAVAGTNSAQQGIPREPSFSRKKKLPDHDRQVTFTTDYTECGTSTTEVRVPGDQCPHKTISALAVNGHFPLLNLSSPCGLVNSD
jgi:hypothetical protein